MAKITAPSKGFNGEVGGVQFTDGVAETDNQAVLSYCRAAGYTVSGKTRALPDAPESPDPREVPAPEASTLRDAAVDPRPEDYLAPTNAGEANPHGPEVVAPEIHASEGARPVKAGEVHVEDAAKQDAAETTDAKKTARAKPAAK